MAGIVVEFFGMPASGKSRLCAAVAPALRNLGWTVVDDPVSRKTSRLFRIARKVPMVLAEYARSARSRALFRLALAPGGHGVRSRLRVAFNILFVRARIASRGRRSREQMLLYDQGCAQALWSAAWVEGALLDSISWPRLTDDLDAAFIVVDVDVPLELAAFRARSRAGGSSPIDGPGQRQADVARAWRVTGEVRAIMRELNGGSVTVLASDGEGSAGVSHLAGTIDKAARVLQGSRETE